MLMFLKKMRKSKAGYTLTELIVVVTVLGILAAVATPFVGDYIGKAKTNADASNAKVMEDIIKRRVMDGTTAEPTDSASAILIIQKELNPLPKIQATGNKFIYVKTVKDVNGNVTTPFAVKVQTAAAGNGEFEISIP